MEHGLRLQGLNFGKSRKVISIAVFGHRNAEWSENMYRDFIDVDLVQCSRIKIANSSHRFAIKSGFHQRLLIANYWTKNRDNLRYNFDFIERDFIEIKCGRRIATIIAQMLMILAILLPKNQVKSLLISKYRNFSVLNVTSDKIARSTRQWTRALARLQKILPRVTVTWTEVWFLRQTNFLLQVKRGYFLR